MTEGKILDLIVLHSEYPEIEISRDKKEVWIDDKLVCRNEDD